MTELYLIDICFRIMLYNIIMKWWWGGDPDALDPKSGLSRRNIYAIQNSWRPIYKDAGNNGVVLFIRFLNFFKYMKQHKSRCIQPVKAPSSVILTNYVTF